MQHDMQGSITILMADDDADDRMMTKEAFEESRLVNDLRFVEDGVELLDYLHRRGKYSDPASSPRPGLILLDFSLDNAAAAGVTSKDLATELDWYMDWSLNDNFTLSFVAAYATPGDAVEQAFDRNEDMFYGMFYVAYTY